MHDVHFEQKKQLDVQLAYVRQLLVLPHIKGKMPIEDFTVFEETAEGLKKAKEQTPEQMMLLVTQVWHPYFEARHEIEKKLALEEMN